MDEPQPVETETKSVTLPVPLWKRITAHQHRRMLPTQRAAHRELLERALEAAEASQ